MTDDKIAVRELLEKGSNASFLREMISFAAERLMALESDALCEATHGEGRHHQGAQRHLAALPRSLYAQRHGLCRQDPAPHRLRLDRHRVRPRTIPPPPASSGARWPINY